ncbi:SEC-C domain-containing protein [Candidatus Methylomirabilis sp.]|uniref:YecA family protein n=1 Tax=Candidatus Methylomirabilis sp. TaxID=2032687 RepID=UPI002A68048A|nr:SEC-C domain-containing protein [Candidatus Methylomirabilis sp.]
MVLAPPYAHLLAAFSSPLIPSIESSPGTRYLVEGTRIVAERPIMRRTVERQVTVSRIPLRETSGDYPLALLIALVLATPGWSLTRRGKVLTCTLALLILTQFLSLLVNIEYTKLWPQKTAAGIVVSTDYSMAKLILFKWLYAFLQLMGRGFFALLLYFGAIALVWGRPEHQALWASVGRNAPCPCGSGLKSKRCCGG